MSDTTDVTGSGSDQGDPASLAAVTHSPMAAQDCVESPDGIAMEAATDDVNWANQLFTTASARSDLKGSLTRDFRLQFFFINQCPPGP